MPLSNKQKNWIVKNQKKHSAKKLAEEIGVSEEAVIEFLNSQKKKRNPFYFYIILIGLPVLFFVLLEIGLRILGYGFNIEQWDTVTEGKLMLNQEIARRYFYNIERIPSRIKMFLMLRRNQMLTEFLFWEKAVLLGYPFSPLGSFSRYIRRQIRTCLSQVNN
ncbi:MAG: hypothetical protein U5J96_12210 [Ignavibacteriaceae bacterium]|nr:hypothetical protein [Ignavibacteriaceae bacterium]